jgi:hypothetical protein
MGFQSQPTTDSISCHTMGFTAQPTFRAHTPGPPLHCPIPPSHAPPATPPNPDPPPPPPPPRRRCRGGHLPSGPPPDGSPLPPYGYLPDHPRPDPKHDEVIFAVPRASSGRHLAAKERKAGRVPAIVFEKENGQEGGNKYLVSVQSKQIRKLVDHLGRSFFLSRQPGLLGARRAGGPRRERSRPAAQGGCSVCLVTANVRCVVSTFVAEAITVRRGLL